MKKIILTSATVLFVGLAVFAQQGTYSKKWYLSESDDSTGHSQDLMFEVRGRYSFPVKKEKLNQARFIRDFISSYPINWVTDYVSVEISTSSNGKSMKAVSSNDALSAEQKNILNSVDLGNDVVIIVKYKSKNAATDNIENNSMHVSMTVIPEIEAEYVGGHREMTKYFGESVISKISEATRQQFQYALFVFTVNEKGEIVNAKISKTSGDAKTDKLLVDAINNMPRWKPAENSKGKKVKQEFVFSVGSGGC